MGPLVSKAQFDKVQGLIEKGIQERATLVTGGAGRPQGFNRGYFVRPTVFGDVASDMTIAKEEIFGPVLSMMTYETEDEAIAIANNTTYGLAGYVQGGVERARRVASKIRAGRVYLNGAPMDPSVPFGGYKQSGNGREHGVFGSKSTSRSKPSLAIRPLKINRDRGRLTCHPCHVAEHTGSTAVLCIDRLAASDGRQAERAEVGIGEGNRQSGVLLSLQDRGGLRRKRSNCREMV
jgi:hypothetical protein